MKWKHCLDSEVQIYYFKSIFKEWFSTESRSHWSYCVLCITLHVHITPKLNLEIHRGSSSKFVTSSDESIIGTAVPFFSHMNTRISLTSSIAAASACWVTRLLCDAKSRAWRTQAVPAAVDRLGGEKAKAARAPCWESALVLKGTFWREYKWKVRFLFVLRGSTARVEAQV